MFTTTLARAAQKNSVNAKSSRWRGNCNIIKYNQNRQHYDQIRVPRRHVTPTKMNTNAHSRSDRGSVPKHLLDVHDVNACCQFLRYCDQSMTCKLCGNTEFVFGDLACSYNGESSYYICCNVCSVNAAEYKLESNDILHGELSDSTLRWVQLANECTFGYVFFEKLQLYCNIKASTKYT